MRFFAFLALLILLCSATLPAQRLMRMYRMTYSLSGFYSTGGSTEDIDHYTGPGTFGTDVDRELVRLSTRNGYFVTRNIVVGVEFGWEQTRTEMQPRPNPNASQLETYERRLFVGPLLRWYQPMSIRWFIYPELSFGYSHYLNETDESALNNPSLPTTLTARGFGLNAGVGLGYFLTRHVVFDAGVRYMHAWRGGEYAIPGSPDRNVEMSEYDVQLLVGFQLLM